ncbi:MAG: formylglycine-generating enzyme family protein [Bacteroidales bacterium]|jgi:formylglycine-generating enzyme required for sulfatase activity|nr:formylglycine-generating enzyme family protein [Bacteroidales bacterium]
MNKNIKKKHIVFSVIILLCCTFFGMATAQNVSGLIARYIDCQAVVKFNLNAADSGTQLTLRYSGDNGTTWFTCTTISGDTGVQTSGSKTIVWDCRADGVVYGVVEFRVDYISDCDEQRYTVKGNNGDTASFTMKCIKGGSLYVGNSPNPLSQSPNVVLSDFSIGEYEVTQALWFAVMGNWPNTSPDTTYGMGDNYPAYYVNWYDVVGMDFSNIGYTVAGVTYYQDGFCYKLSQLLGGNKKFCLPTEAQWEYAARGGQQTHGYYYSGSDTIDDVAWYGDNSYSKVHEVGGKAANELGLYDMSGNVLEWCSDRYGGSYPSSDTNPAGAGSGDDRVYRGGCRSSGRMQCRVHTRGSFGPYQNREILGFRLAMTQ